MRVFSSTEPRAAVAEFPQLWLSRREGHWMLCTLEAGRAHGPGVILKLQGVDDRDVASQWVGATLAIERSWLPPVPEGEYYWADLQGLCVENRAGVVMGHVDGFIETGANDVLVARGEREHLIPWVHGQYILEVDMSRGRILVDWDPEF